MLDLTYLVTLSYLLCVSSNKAQLIASASRSLDTGLTEDVSLTSVATQYFTIDEDFLDPWSDESEIQLNGNFFQDHVLVDCEPFLLE